MSPRVGDGPHGEAGGEGSSPEVTRRRESAKAVRFGYEELRHAQALAWEQAATEEAATTIQKK